MYKGYVNGYINFAPILLILVNRLEQELCIGIDISKYINSINN